MHSLSELAAVITQELSSTIVLLWRDGSAKFIFGTGSRYETLFPSVDAAIQILTDPACPFSNLGQFDVHRVPAEAATGEQVLEWFQSLPEVYLEFSNQGQA